MSLDLKQYSIILGSSSDRRLSILKEVLKINHITVVKPDFEENLSKSLPPKEYVRQTSYHKLLSIIDVESFESPTIVICCDTIIDCDGKILEKPTVESKQRQMLQSYKQLEKIEVISSVHIAKIEGKDVQIVGDSVITTLNYDTSISDDVIDQYIDSGEGLNVAGGFKYQEMGNILFLSINGDYFNVVGLPAKRTFELIRQLLSSSSN